MPLLPHQLFQVHNHHHHLVSIFRFLMIITILFIIMMFLQYHWFWHWTLDIKIKSLPHHCCKNPSPPRHLLQFPIVSGVSRNHPWVKPTSFLIVIVKPKLQQKKLSKSLPLWPLTGCSWSQVLHLPGPLRGHPPDQRLGRDENFHQSQRNTHGYLLVQGALDSFSRQDI